MIRLEDIFVVFNANTPLERIALRGINLEIQKGEVVSIVGNSGSGRTSLLKFLAGHIIPSFGKLWYDDVDITRQNLIERSAIFSSVFYDQNSSTAENLTVAENLALANIHHQSKSCFEPALNSVTKEKIFQQLRDINFMGLENLLDEVIGNLSKPHRQVLALLIAATKGTGVVLIDEHSTGLDQNAAAALLETTTRIIRENKLTTIMAVCDPKYAMSVSDKVVVLSHGQIVSELSGEEKRNMSVEQLFSSFNVIPPLKEIGGRIRK